MVICRVVDTVIATCTGRKKHVLDSWVFWTLVFCLTILADLHAAGLPDPAAEQRRQKEREDVLRGQLERSRDISLSQPGRIVLPRIPDTEKPCFNITRVVLIGEMSGKFEWLLEKRVWKLFGSAPLDGEQGDDSPVGRCLGTKGIDMVLRRLQNALVDNGYVTTRVMVAPQDLKSGTLTITLVPGRIRFIRLAPGSSRRATLWNVLPFREGDVLNLRDIEQALENLKRVSTVEADIKIVPSEGLDDKLGVQQKAVTSKPGESDLIITYKQALPVRLNLGFDDSGSKATGKHMASGTLILDTPLLINDMFYISASRSAGHVLVDSSNGESNHIFGGTSPGSRENSSETIHYQIPYGHWLLAATAGRNRYHQAVAGINQSYTYRGTGDNLEVKLSRLVYPYAGSIDMMSGYANRI